jgi:AraC-like DNA-binding protein
MAPAPYLARLLDRVLSGPPPIALHRAQASPIPHGPTNRITGQHRLWWMLGGTMRWLLSRDGTTAGEYRLGAGHLLYLPPWAWIRPLFGSAFSYVYLNLDAAHWSLHWDRRAASDPPVFGPKVRLFATVPPPPAAVDCLRLIEQHAGADDAGLGRHLGAAVFHAVRGALPRAQATRRDAAWHRLRALIEDEPEASWTRGELAARLDVHPGQVSRLCREVGAETLRDLIERLRLERAAAELRAAADPVAAIARRCGFADPGYFNRRFRRRYGVSPGRWRA